MLDTTTLNAIEAASAVRPTGCWGQGAATRLIAWPRVGPPVPAGPRMPFMLPSLLGQIPFAEGGLVYLPPHATRRPDEVMERAFAKDALLYKRHPRAYRCLHARERHSGKESYRCGLLRGAEEYGVEVTPLLEPPIVGRPLVQRVRSIAPNCRLRPPL